MKWIALVLPFVMHNAHAVKVADCPSRLKVQLSKIEVTRTEAQVLRALEDYAVEDEKIGAVKVLLKQLPTAAYEEDFSIQAGESKNGRCVYQNINSEKYGESALLFTSKGKDQLMVQTNAGTPYGILVRTYIPLQEVTTDGVYLAELDSRVTLAVPRSNYKNYSAGGPLVTVGKTGEVGVD